MRKIKGYKDFSPISESLGFGNSDEYFNLKNTYSKKENQEIKEYFYELTDDDIMEVRVWSYIGESDSGRSIGYSQSSVDIGKNHSIFYTINLKSKKQSLDLLNINNKTENLRKVGENLKKLADTIDTFRSAFSDELVVDTLQGSVANFVTFCLSAEFVIRGESVNKDDLETYYKKWKGNFGRNYTKGLDYLIEEYRINGVQDPPLDINDHGSNDVLVGFLTEDDIIVVATYHRSSDSFDIDWTEFRRSLTELPGYTE